jgi:hypothetical protein
MKKIIIMLLLLWQSNLLFAQFAKLETVLGSGKNLKSGERPLFDKDPFNIDLITQFPPIHISEKGVLYSTFLDTLLYKLVDGKAIVISNQQKILYQHNEAFYIDSKGYIYGFNKAKSRIGRQDTLGIDLQWLSDSIITASAKSINELYVDTFGGMFYSQNNSANLYSMLFYLGPDGVHQKLAGNGIMGYSGDGGLAKDAQVCIHSKAILTKDSNLLFINSNHLSRGAICGIRKIDLKTGMISTVVGGNKNEYSPDGVIAKDANFRSILSFTSDKEGNIYFIEDDSVAGHAMVDSASVLIRRVDSKTGIVTTLAGNKGKPMPIFKINKDGVRERFYDMSKDGSPALGSTITAYLSDLQIDPEERYLYFRELNGCIRRFLIKDEGTNIHEHPALQAFTLYPNPATTTLYLNGISKQIPYRIVDIQGRVLQQAELNGISIDIATLPQGMYVLQIDGYKSVMFEKR